MHRHMITVTIYKKKTKTYQHWILQELDNWIVSY